MLWGWWNIFDPLSLRPAIFLDRKRSGFVLENTDRITQWNDISGNNNHATATTGSAARPTLVADGVQFDGVGNYLSVPTSMSISSPYTWAFVLKDGTYNGRYLLAPNAFTKFPGVFSSTDTQSVVTGAPNVPFDVSDKSSGGIVVHWVNNGASSFLRQNGIEYSPQTQSAITLNGLIIGGDIRFNTRAYATFQSVLIFPRALTDSERTEVEAYLVKGYNITL